MVGGLKAIIQKMDGQLEHLQNMKIMIFKTMKIVKICI